MARHALEQERKVYAPTFQPGFFSPWCGQFTLLRGNGDVRLSSLSLYGSEVLHFACADTRPVPRQRLVGKSIGCAC
jgi:hypothetical protein